MKKLNKKNGGFSLVELVVVVSIMAVLVGVLSPSLLRYVEKSRAQKDNSNMQLYARNTIYALADEKTYNEVMDYSKETGKSKVSLIFTPYSNTMYVEKTDTEESAQAISKMPTLIDELKDTVAESVTLTSSTYKDKQYTIEITVDDSSTYVSVYGFWGIRKNIVNPVANKSTSPLKDAFTSLYLESGTSAPDFLVFNSTYTNNNAGIKALKNKLGSETEIKTWSVIKASTNKKETSTENNVSYLFSTIDISNTSQWSAGDQIPAIYQRENGTIEVGMATLYLQKDSATTTPYYVISRDANDKYAHESGFDRDTIISDKKTFSNLEEAYGYYETLGVIKQG